MPAVRRTGPVTPGSARRTAGQALQLRVTERQCNGPDPRCAARLDRGSAAAPVKPRCLVTLHRRAVVARCFRVLLLHGHCEGCSAFNGCPAGSVLHHHAARLCSAGMLHRRGVIPAPCSGSSGGPGRALVHLGKQPYEEVYAALACLAVPNASSARTSWCMTPSPTRSSAKASPEERSRRGPSPGGRKPAG